MGLKPTIERICPRTDPRWEALVTTYPSTVFHSPRWMSVLHDIYGFKPFAYVAAQGGELTAGVPVCLADELVRQRYISLPFSDFCEIVGTDEDARQAVADKAFAECLPWSLRSRISELPQTSVPVSGERRYFWHCIDIRPELEQVGDSFHKSVRRSIKRSARDGVVVTPAQSKEDLRSWYRLQLRLRKMKHGLLAQPYSFFEAIWDQIIEPGAGVLLVARHNGEIIGGEIDLVWKDTLYAKFAAVSLESLQLRANHLLTWEAIRYGKSRGLSVYDLGRTNVSQDGLIEFKRSFNAIERELVTITYGQVEPPSHSERQLTDAINKLSGLLADQSVSDAITERAGEILYRYFA